MRCSGVVPVEMQREILVGMAVTLVHVFLLHILVGF
jgi:hypothetical protein